MGAVEVNAFQVMADVVIQKSLREGFGLTVSEALWKARPTIGGKVGGIRTQIIDGETGYLVSSPEECAARCLDLLADPARAAEMGRRGKEVVRRHFLAPRELRDTLRVCAALREGAPGRAPPARAGAGCSWSRTGDRWCTPATAASAWPGAAAAAW